MTSLEHLFHSLCRMMAGREVAQSCNRQEHVSLCA